MIYLKKNYWNPILQAFFNDYTTMIDPLTDLKETKTERVCFQVLFETMRNYLSLNIGVFEIRKFKMCMSFIYKN